MFLLLAVVAGIIVGLARARLGGRRLRSLSLRYEWLVLVGFIPQLVAFQIPQVSRNIPDDLARVALVGSQALLIVFAAANWRKPGFWALGLGLILNFLVIVLNGGLMPISPHLLERYLGPSSTGLWQVGERMGYSKDIILPISETRLWWLSDRFTLPEWSPYKVAFSVGDIIIGLGAFLLFWSLGGPEKSPEGGQQ